MSPLRYYEFLELVGLALRRLQWALRTGWFFSAPLLALAVVVIWLWPRIYVPVVDEAHPHALYLLSAIAQSLAAILAIIFTITLVAAQLSSRYSHRMLPNFFDLKTVLYILLLILAVLLPLGLLAEPNPILVKLSLTLAIASLLLLIPYFLHFRDKLRLELIPLELRHKAARELQTEHLKESDAVADIYVFAVNAFVLKDYDAFRAGTEALVDLVIDIYLAQIEADQAAIKGPYWSGSYPTPPTGLLERIRDIGLVTLADPVASQLVIQALRHSLTKGREKGVAEVASDAAQILGYIGSTAIEQRVEWTLDKVAAAFTDICSEALTKHFGIQLASDAAAHLKNIAIGAIEKGLVTVVRRAAEGLGEIGVQRIRVGWAGFTIPTYEPLRTLRMRHIPPGATSFIAKIAADLGDIGIMAAKKCPSGTETAFKQLWEMGAWATKENNEDLKKCIVNSIKRIEEKAAHNPLWNTYANVMVVCMGWYIGDSLTEFKTFYETFSSTKAS